MTAHDDCRAEIARLTERGDTQFGLAQSRSDRLVAAEAALARVREALAVAEGQIGIVLDKLRVALVPPETTG